MYLIFCVELVLLFNFFPGIYAVALECLNESRSVRVNIAGKEYNVCVCKQGFTEKDCSVPLDLCNRHCKPLRKGITCRQTLCNQGECISTSSEPYYSCNCGPFYEGSNCEVENNPCSSESSNPCGHGHCEFIVGTSQVNCHCYPGWTASTQGITKYTWKGADVYMSAPCIEQVKRGITGNAPYLGPTVSVGTGVMMDKCDSVPLYLDIYLGSESSDPPVKSEPNPDIKLDLPKVDFRVKTISSRSDVDEQALNSVPLFDSIWFVEFDRPMDVPSFHEYLKSVFKDYGPEDETENVGKERKKENEDYIIKDEEVDEDTEDEEVNGMDEGKGGAVTNESSLQFRNGGALLNLVNTVKFDNRDLSNRSINDIIRNTPYLNGPKMSTLPSFIANKNHLSGKYYSLHRYLKPRFGVVDGAKCREFDEKLKTRKALEDIDWVMSQIAHDPSRDVSSGSVYCGNYSSMLMSQYKQFLKCVYKKHKHSELNNGMVQSITEISRDISADESSVGIRGVMD